MKLSQTVYLSLSLCLSTAGPTDRSVQKLAHGCDRNERGTNLFLIRITCVDTLLLLSYSFSCLTWCSCAVSPQIKVEFSMKFTSRDLSLKRTPSKKQSGVFGVKISVVTKWVKSWTIYIHVTCSILISALMIFLSASSFIVLCFVFLLRRERSKVPYIVRQCIEEVEKRGIDEVGIYRISGVATDIQALKAAFDTSKSLSANYTPSYERSSD